MFAHYSLDHQGHSHLSASKSNLTVNASYHRSPSPFVNRCSAYFLQRLDLSNYSISTLKYIVETNIPAESRLKGLKVKLSLPDDGFIVDNTADPNQSWMYKRKELLYFWQHPLRNKVIVIISKNRPTHDSKRPYSASIFALRGHNSVQPFLQRAHEFFVLLASSNPLERSATIDSRASKTKKIAQRTNSSKLSTRKSSHSTPRTEFQPIHGAHGSRTLSETTASSESQSRRSHSHYDDERLVITRTPISADHVAELVKELKELRQEIATLKLENRATPVRSISTSPLSFQRPSSADIDAETQTDFTLFNHRRRLLARKGKTNGTDTSETIGDHVNGERPHISSCSPINGSDPEDVTKDTPSQFRVIQEESNKTVGTVSFQSELEDTIEPPEHLYENIPVLIQMNPSQGSYYNLPIFKDEDKVSANGYLYVAFAKDPESKAQQQQYLSQLFHPKNGLSFLISPQETPKTPPLTTPTPDSPSVVVPDPPKAPPRLPPSPPIPPAPTVVQFANHLTNPSFYVDKQLLANTIANQFGVDLQSPYLPQLISNQHLFVAQKRTFANMVWQLTPDEFEALCSSPSPIHGQSIQTESNSSNHRTTRSILKGNRPFRSVSKRQRISWNTSSL